MRGTFDYLTHLLYTLSVSIWTHSVFSDNMMVLSVVATLGYFATSLKKHVMLSRRDSSIPNQATPLVLLLV